MKIHNISLLGLLVLSSMLCASESTQMLRQPDLSDEHLAFVYAGDIWVSNTDGSHPRRLTSHPATESDPIFSPDGKWIAFSATYEDNRDVYIIPVAGGQPTRLTWHPYSDVPQDWSSDSSAVIFASARETDHGRSRQLYQVSITGGAPEKLMLARIVQGQFSSKGQLAYIPFHPAYNGLFGGSSGWKGYRGGTTPDILLLNPDQSELQTIPGEGVNDINPMWIGSDVYFLSDRQHKTFNLYRYRPNSKQVEALTEQSDWDIRSASAHGNAVVYEAGGRLYHCDVNKGSVSEIKISIQPDLPQLRPQWKDASRTITHTDLSKSAKRVLLSARGEIFTIPVEEGPTRNLSHSGNANDRSALWSPDGQQIAWITENEQGGQSVALSDQFGKDAPRLIPLGSHFYELLAWIGGDSPSLIYADNHLGLHLLDLDTGTSTLLATHARRASSAVAVAPDAKWIAYTLEQPNFHSDLMLYELASGQHHRLSDGMADVESVTFGPKGDYLYFTASTNSGPVQVGLNMSSREHPLRAGLYAVALKADGTSPLIPETGDEPKPEEKDKDEEDKESNSSDDNEQSSDDEESSTDTAEATVDATTETDPEDAENEPCIELEGIAQRIFALPVAERNIGNLGVDKDGNVYYIEYVQSGIAQNPPGQSIWENNRLMRFDMEEKEESELLRGIWSFVMNADRTHLLLNKVDGSLAITEVGKSAKAEGVSTSDCRVWVNPREEWLQIFNEVWRMQKEYFYAPNLHGLDWQAVYDQYRPRVDHVGRREDLNELLVEMIAELHAGHNRVGGGDLHKESAVQTGLLGANIDIHEGRYRLQQVYRPAPWLPFIDAPLAVPGQSVDDGSYLIAINHTPLSASDNLFQRLQGTVGKQVTLTIAATPDGSDSRDIVVSPISDESRLRLWDWVERNRRKVEEQSEGKVGYVFLPNTAGDGYDFFNRMFYAQVDKEALIVDERSNGGGQAADYLIETLARKHLSGWADRDGLTYNTPSGALHGPKVMIIDQDAGSGGDYLPFMFRYTGTGKLLGTRTWGGLIGISANPPLMDGGFLTVPFFRFFDADGNWSVENEGVAPDIEVKLNPIATNKGIDTQLDAAIAHILQELESYEPEVLTEAPALPTELGE